MTAMASARSRYLRRMCGGAVHARRGEGSVEAADDARGAGGGGFLGTISWRRCGAAERALVAARSAWVWVSPVVGEGEGAAVIASIAAEARERERMRCDARI